VTTGVARVRQGLGGSRDDGSVVDAGEPFLRGWDPLRIEELPVPQPADDEVLVRVEAAGICGSDLHIALEGVTPTAFVPITLGHEPAGVVAGLGATVTGWTAGERVVVVPIISCDSCPLCLSGRSQLCPTRRLIGIHTDGALAEYLVAPAKNLVRLPESVGFEVGAIITDAVATPFHALSVRAGLVEGESIAIYGVGGLGLHAVQLAKLLGATQIIAIDVRPEQLERARALGADHCIDSRDADPVDAVMEATGGRGVDVAAEFVGLATTIAAAAQSVVSGGRVIVAGLGPEPITVQPPTVFVRKEISLLGSYGFTKANIERLVELTATGQLDLAPSVTHTFPLDNAQDALEALDTKLDNPVRIVVRP
jgi:2-desacetyl-2-hydroxyethyl bacteriochlorophyllide A dehydrogenase